MYLASKAIKFGEKRKKGYYAVQGQSRSSRSVPTKSVIIELFSLNVMAEALWAKVDRKSVISLQRSQFYPKFQVEGNVPTNFCMDS